MSTLEVHVFRQYYVELIEALPMDDPIFIAMLFSRHLITSYQKEEIEVLGTVTRKAEFFLNVISLSLSAHLTVFFIGLLDIMNDYDSPRVQAVAKQIKSELKEVAANTAG